MAGNRVQRLALQSGHGIRSGNVETCVELTGSNTAIVVKEVFRGGFFGLSPSLYSAKSLTLMRAPQMVTKMEKHEAASFPARSDSPDTHYIEDEASKSQARPDTDYPRFSPGSGSAQRPGKSHQAQQPPIDAKPSSHFPSSEENITPHHPPLTTTNVTVSISRDVPASQSTTDVYVCPMKLPGLGGEVNVFVLESGQLRPLLPDQHEGLISELDIEVLMPREVHSAAVGFSVPRADSLHFAPFPPPPFHLFPPGAPPPPSVPPFWVDRHDLHHHGPFTGDLHHHPHFHRHVFGVSRIGRLGRHVAQYLGSLTDRFVRLLPFRMRDQKLASSKLQSASSHAQGDS